MSYGWAAIFTVGGGWGGGALFGCFGVGAPALRPPVRFFWRWGGIMKIKKKKKNKIKNFIFPPSGGPPRGLPSSSPQKKKKKKKKSKKAKPKNISPLPSARRTA